MRLFVSIIVLLVGLGGVAIGSRIPADTHTLTRQTVVVPDRQVAGLTARVAELEAQVLTLRSRPSGLDGNEVRTLVETILPEPVEVPDEATTTTTSAPKEGE